MMKRRAMLGALLLCGLVATASLAASGTTLDRSTGATLQLSTEPWVLALDQPHLAAHARDYIALYAVEINTSGKRSYLLAAFLWSTVPGRTQYAGDKPVVQLRVADRTLSLDPLGRTPRDMGISHWPMKPPGRGAVLAIYEVDEALLRAMSTDIEVKVRAASDPTLPEDVWFDVWRSGRTAFADFCARTME